MSAQIAKLRYGLKLTAVYSLTAVFIMSPSWLGDFRSKQKVESIKSNLSSSEAMVQSASPVVTVIGKPNKISFIKGNRTLPITEGIFDPKQGTWLVRNNVVEWIKAQQEIRDGILGHTILYGHNNPNVLGLTKNIVSGDLVTITHENTEVVYEYTADEKVAPTDLAILTADRQNTLTLITCYGKNNELRRLMHFSFKGVQ